MADGKCCPIRFLARISGKTWDPAQPPGEHCACAPSCALHDDEAGTCVFVALIAEVRVMSGRLLAILEKMPGPPS